MMMKKEEVRALWLDYTNGTLSPESQSQVENYLAEHPEMKAEFESLGTMWYKIDDLPFPEASEAMDMKFQAMLQGYEMAQEKSSNSLLSKLSKWIEAAFQTKMAFASMVLLIGIAIGYFFSAGNESQQQLASLNSEVHEMKKMMMLTLLEQPQARDRLKAVQISNELLRHDDNVIDALLETLNKDKNVNVRLVAAQSLAALASDPKVRAGLIQSISTQTSPVVQSALADIMINLQAKNAVEEFQKLLEKDELDTLVKEKIQTTIQTLI
ncbi:MAG: HEAT repeat domain-containing protein [Cyclobacteriaceae bacterium]